MSVPTYATHYYLPERGPFRSLSDLPLGASDPVFLELLSRHQRDDGYRRRYGRDYIDKRKAVEAKLRQLFIARGGQPLRRSPFYLILGDSPWFERLNEGHRELRVNLSDLHPLMSPL
jgi:hypothetical protein